MLPVVEAAMPEPVAVIDGWEWLVEDVWGADVEDASTTRGVAAEVPVSAEDAGDAMKL